GRVTVTYGPALDAVGCVVGEVVQQVPDGALPVLGPFQGDHMAFDGDHVPESRFGVLVDEAGPPAPQQEADVVDDGVDVDVVDQSTGELLHCLEAGAGGGRFGQYRRDQPRADAERSGV